MRFENIARMECGGMFRVLISDGSIIRTLA